MGFQGSLIGVSLVNSEADIRSRVYWPWYVSTRQFIDWVVWLVMQFFVESGYLPSVSYLTIKRCPFWELSLRSIVSFAVPKPFNFTSPHLTTVTLISWVTGVPFRKVVDRPVRGLSGQRRWLLSLTTWVGSLRIHRMEGENQLCQVVLWWAHTSMACGFSCPVISTHLRIACAWPVAPSTLKINRI